MLPILPSQRLSAVSNKAMITHILAWLQSNKSKKQMNNNNTTYNELPDIISHFLSLSP